MVFKILACRLCVSSDQYPKPCAAFSLNNPPPPSLCQLQLGGIAAAKALGRIKSRLKAIFLTLSPALYSFAQDVGPEIAEHVLTSSSWHPMMLGQGDSFFGTPNQYAAAFEEATGRPPSFVPALASGTVVSILVLNVQFIFLE